MALSSLQLEAFAEVCRSSGFSAAANRLGITQSALSQRVMNLEDELGTTLLIRDSGGPKLTAAGEELLRHCRRRELDESETLAVIKATGKTKAGAPLSGTIRIGAFSTVMRSVALEALAPWLRRNPQVALDLWSAELRELPEGLASGRSDLILTDRSVERGSVESVKLGDEELVLVESERHRARDGVYLDHDPEDRTTEDFLGRQPALLRPVRFERSYLDHIDALLDGVRAGIGRAVVPRHLLTGLTGLREVVGQRSVRSEVYLCRHRQPYYSRIEQLVFEELRRGAKKILG